MKKNILESIKRIKKINIETHLKCIFWVILICGISTGLSILLNSMGIGKENTLMIFLVGVLAITVLTKGYFYGFIASVISFLMFNYFFTQPQYSFIISNVQDLILIVFFLIASLISGTLSSKFQSQTEIAISNERTAKLLYDISESFLNLSGTPSIVKNGINYIFQYTSYPCSVKLDNDKFDVEDTQYSTSNFRAGEYDESELYSLPIKGLANEIGRITLANVSSPLSDENDMLIKTVVYQMALVLDREFIYKEREKIKLAMESEYLKSTLLRSISHDLRTPLTGIIGASSLILDSYESLNDESIQKLISDINEESTWLIKSVQNILDMTQISGEHFTLLKEYDAVEDIINQAITQVPLLTTTNRLKVTIPDDIILAKIDGKRIVQVLVNLLDNAYKHSGSNSQVELNVFYKKEEFIFEVSDNGIGIDEAIKDTLFNEFITLPRNIADSSRGVGLGLAICKAIVNAHNGKIIALNKPGGGAVFRIELPYEEE